MCPVSRVKVLIVTTGNDRSEIALYRGLKDRGVELEVLCVPGAGGQEALVAHGIPVRCEKIRHRLDLVAVRRVRRRIDEGGFDIVHAPRNHTLAVALLAVLRRPRVGVVAYRGTSGHLSRLDPASWLTYLNPRIDRIICVSEAVRAYLLEKGIPAGRLVTIYKGHDVLWYQPESRADLASLGIPPGAFVVGFTGNVRPVKGVEYLLGAARLLPRDSAAHFLIVGHTPDGALPRLAADPAIRERVHLTGFRSDAAALAGACDAYVMPSVAREGLPRGVIEAMCQSVPPIVSNVGGLPELVQHEQSGLVVPPRDSRALAEAIGRLAADRELARRLGANARRRIEEQFNIATTIEEVDALYEAVRRERGGAS